MPSSSVQPVQVLIPYFQRKPGLLRAALESVFRQAGVERPKVCVIDDGSPCPAEPEIDGLPGDWRSAITLLHQRNRGPAAARNRGLDALAADAEYVAFLDSDDRWRPNHLSRALRALQSGVDFYFCERWVDQTGAAGSKSRRDPFLPPLLPLLPELGIHRIEEELFRVVWSSLVPMSGVVYRHAKFSTQRFNERLKWAEDYLFSLSILQTARAMAFDAEPGYDLGQGVNISWAKWGSPEHLRGTVDTNEALRYMIGHLDLPQSDQIGMRAALVRSRNDLASEILHHVRRGRLGVALSILAADPPVLGYIGMTLTRLCLGRQRREHPGPGTGI